MFRRKPSACSGKTLFPRTSRARGPAQAGAHAAQQTLVLTHVLYQIPPPPFVARAGPRVQARGRPWLEPGHASQGQGFAGLVAMARGQTPDPIPNSAVKTLSADRTAAQAARPASPNLSPLQLLSIQVGNRRRYDR